MCGRYTDTKRKKAMLSSVGLEAELAFVPRYNIAPTQDVVAVADFGSGLEARLITWGLIPSWSTDGKGFINARAETLEERPSFNESFRLRRCLIPANGFFEWKRSGREKRPFYFQSHDESAFAFAGVWDTWKIQNRVITTCAIITTPANDLVGELHDRMPAILAAEFHDAWLNPKTTRVELLRMLQPFPASLMKTHPVSSRVNSTENDSADLLLQVDAEVGQTLSLF